MDRPVPTGRDAGAQPARRRRTQQERSTETRAKLINAAIELVRESGFARLTIMDVARRAGLTTGAVQHHFSSSRELIREVVQSVYPLFRASFEEVGNPRMSLTRRFEKLVDICGALYMRPEYLVFWDLVFGTRDHRELRDVLNSFQKEIVAAAVSDLVKAFADIRMKPDTAFTLWTFVTSQLRGLALLSLFEGKQVLDADVRLLKKAVCLIFLERVRKE